MQKKNVHMQGEGSGHEGCPKKKNDEDLQIPTDDPGHEFSAGGIGVGVSRSGNGDQTGHLGV